MRSFPILIFALFINNSAFSQSTINKEGFETFEYVDGDTTYLMKKYFLCVYTRGDQKAASEEESAKLQQAHLAYQSQMAEDNKLCMAGPFGDDGDWRGILVLSVRSEEEARDLLDNDPFVKRGMLKYILKPWWAAVGTKLF